VLAAGADREVSEMRTELRAHTQTLNALRETQLDFGREMGEGFAAQGQRVDGLERRSGEMLSLFLQNSQCFPTANRVDALLCDHRASCALRNLSVASSSQTYYQREISQ